jgi:hypothetical protein
MSSFAMTNAKEQIFERLITAYRMQIEGERFNGIKLQEVDEGIDDDALFAAIFALVQERKIDIICSQTQLNPHIKRHPPVAVETQLKKLNIRERYHTCLYPTAETVQSRFDLTHLNDWPFTREIAEGAEELRPKFFELSVLDRYRLDPRYAFHFSEYAGHISILSGSEKTGPIPERDQTLLQTFGLGIDDSEDAVVCVFLRYLSQLSSEHQRFWQTFSAVKPALMHEHYYKSSYLGEFYENNSAISALRLAIASINKISRAVWNASIFLHDVPSDVHYNLSPFMRSAKADYLSFVHELDKLISENINTKFFDGKIERTVTIHHKDGTIERKSKATITLLEEWLFDGSITWQDTEMARREIIEPLRKIRKERQPAAHKVIKNEFDRQFTIMKRDLLRDAAFALGNICHTLRKYPGAPPVRFPKWFEEGRIDTF